MPGKILVTGGTGYLGGWVVEALLTIGYAVTLLTKKPVEHNHIRNVVADLTNREAVAAALANQTFDAVIHLAAADQRQERIHLFKVNYGGTLNLLLTLKATPPKQFIYLSSFKVYGMAEGHITENTPTQAAEGTYGQAKTWAEVLVQVHCAAMQTRATIFRLSNGYGAPRQTDIAAWHLLFNSLCRSAFETGQIQLHAPPDTQLDMIWLGDVCQVITQALEHPTINGTFNLGFGKSITTGEVAKAVAVAYQEYTGKQLEILQPAPAGNIQPLLLDCNKLQNILPYQPQHRFHQEALKVFELLAGN